MSVANTLKTPIVAPCIDIQYANGGSGPTPGLYLPLAGGTMDASPSGVINAHTITGLTTLEGDNLGNDFSILTQAGGGDIDIDATASSGAVNVDCVAHNVNASQTIELIANGSFLDLICPTGILKAGDPLAAGNLAKIEINNTSSASQIVYEATDINLMNNRLQITPNGNIAYTNDDFGLRVADYNNNAGNNQSGVIVQKITNQTGDAYGVRVIDIDCLGNTRGAEIANITTQTGNTIGCAITSVNSTNGFESTGLDINDITSGSAGAYGVRMLNITGGPGQEANGIRLENITTDTNVAKGMFLTAINAVSGGSSFGVEVKGVGATGAGSAYAFSASSVSTETGPAIGLNMANINATTGAGSGAFGSYIQNVVGQTDATGYSIITCDCVAGPAVGVQIGNVNATGSGLGNENATGVGVQGVFCSATSGMTATGVKIQQAQGDLATGVSATGITALTNDAYGVEVRDVNAVNLSHGVFIDSVSSTGNDAYGLYIDNVSSTGGGAYGIFQTSSNPNVSNVLRNNIECGAGELSSSTTATIRAFGTLQASVQSSAAGTYDILNNAGNVVVSLAGNTGMRMPTTRFTGAIYTITKKHGGAITIQGNGANVNGSASFNFSGAAYGTMTIVWDGTEWLAHLN